MRSLAFVQKIRATISESALAVDEILCNSDFNLRGTEKEKSGGGCKLSDRTESSLSVATKKPPNKYGIDLNRLTVLLKVQYSLRGNSRRFCPFQIRQILSS